ncbi:MAG: DUF86 domain-containing protein [Phycisphaerales bacterium]|nr:DUF86 domain-containing protein [Phycisphaerales bacterium]
MSHDAWRERVRVKIEDAERILRFIGDLDRDSFRADEQVVFAVCYAFVRLGEAVSHVPESVRDANPRVEWGEIRHFRNFMIHVYPAVDPGRLYDTAHADLPPLIEKLRGLLGP